MIRSIEIHNFRCYEHLEIRDCARLNVLVGENGSGKTSLLEAIFLTLATGTEVAMRLRQQRGLEGSFTGSARRVEEAAWVDFFYDYDMIRPIEIVLKGSGPETRNLEIAKGSGGATLPLSMPSGVPEPITLSPIVFTWTDAKGVPRTITPKIGPVGFALPDTGEDMPDFYFFGSNQVIGAVENAGRFSELSKENRQRQFVEIFTKEYPWIKDINVEVHAGAPALFATLEDNRHKVPLPNVSTGINRALSYMLSIAVRPRAVVIVDEIENGIYYTNMTGIWKSVIALLREYDCQMFVSTHSHECLEALVEAAGDDVSDIALWRTERDGESRAVRRFEGEDFKASVKYGQEVR